MTDPLVSILMTAYNRERFISEAIESVIASIYQNWELIIVDDKSSDKTVEIARLYEAEDKRIIVKTNEKNLGDYQNRNIAAGYADGKYIKYLDSDDIIYPHGLEVMVRAMEQFPEAGIGLCYNNYEEEIQLPIKLTSEEAYQHHFFKKGLLYVGPSGSIYNREFFFKTGKFSKYGVASDYEFHLRGTALKPLVLFQRDLIWWRQHDGQEYINRENEYLEQNYKILTSVFKSQHLPLNKKLAHRATDNYQKSYSRKILKRIVLFQFRKAKSIIRFTDISFRYYILALLPKKLRNLFYTKPLFSDNF